MEFSELYVKWNKEIEIPIQEVILPVFLEKKVHVCVKREDLNHQYISGNKLRKLKYNILKASELNEDTLLTFGGAFSNHILATASAGYESGFKTIGVIRGDELEERLEEVLEENETLKLAHHFGMQFYFVSREDYRQKEDPVFIEKLREKFGTFYMIPEGGTNDLAVKGTEEILKDAPQTYNFDYITCAMGTGGTISGIINASQKHQTVLGFPALKESAFFEAVIDQYTLKRNYNIITDYHFGGFAKYNEELIRFINDVKMKTQLPLDPIYTGKMFYGLVDMVKNDYFEENSRILMIHTGGLQGIKGFNEKLKRKNQILIK
ncbi:1-aminocyclopropane-1-carboxylate deaminase [Flavobacteriaceae bacterium UJ101]|nr:1-aminocyclopropane-1-carboxylate deaminase [Flavobacteriaceae bacterium UJ101]